MGCNVKQNGANVPMLLPLTLVQAMQQLFIEVFFQIFNKQV